MPVTKRFQTSSNQDRAIAKILITGATGFVGSHVLETLMAIQHQAVDIVAACRNPRRLITSYRGEVRVGDLRDPDYLERVLAGIDVVCHCAGWSNFTTDEAASRRLYLEPSLELINQARHWQTGRFINFSSLALAPLAYRAQPQIRGKPRRHSPMFNCMLAVEDYLQAQASERFSVINLRIGIYSGQRLHLGLLRYLLQTTPRLPEILGRYAYLPLVDGRDIGQAFARAALAPLQQAYTSLNIVGPVVPKQHEVYRYINELQNKRLNSFRQPLAVARSLNWLRRWLPELTRGSRWPSTLLQLLANPDLNNQRTESIIGYMPQYHWKSSVMESLRRMKQSAEITEYRLKDDGIIFPEQE